jgi:uncharacterized protein (DUF58 family)
VGLGLAAMNTGNNLLYLLLSMLLGLITVSGVLSERSIRGLRLVAMTPDEVFAGRPVVVGARVVNAKSWATSYSVAIEVLPGGPTAYVPRLEAGAERIVTWRQTLPRRGRHALARVRITTRFPFGLFVKASRPALGGDVVVFPALIPLSRSRRRALDGSGPTTVERRGRGADVFDLRAYRAGDDPRFIHWRSSAKVGNLLVREPAAEAAEDARIVLKGGGDAERLERGISEAASLVVHLLRAGAAVELEGPGVFVPLAAGRQQQRRVLTALALYEIPATVAPRAARRPLREILVDLG